ncbi:PGPGW domain-containing protein [Thalassoroseus pseudoceratinae]|uniref:PGPGW domain-containing protein n=1 Tax=Thalassoroseus pseudoceratinae TaxID=2713176 RepID=UPI00141E3B0E|nr:PGPGW domain-containing protein [Thalassoroseus pseudoceratinae]
MWTDLVANITDWMDEHNTFVWTLSIVSALTFIASLMLVPFLITRVRADYFVTDEPSAMAFATKHPVWRGLFLVAKNLLGIILLLGGILMLALPGQGLLTILIGISLLNFPGKRELELWIIRRPAIYRTINWIRIRRGGEPLQLPEATE